MDQGRSAAGDAAKARRVELILQQVGELPTLNSIAMRVLELTSQDDCEAREVIDVISADPSLAAKVLKLCRTGYRSRAMNVTTLDRAVLLMGFDAVRSLVLSVQVFEVFDNSESAGGEIRTEPVFNRKTFWQHSLAVGILCEMLASTGGLRRELDPSEAFLSGLLHDLGMLGLHVVLPKSFDQVCRYAEAQGMTLDQACRTVIGLDTHTAGKRLAEHWHLPERLADVMWLNGQQLSTLPDMAHRRQIALVTLADHLARGRVLSPIGHGPQGDDVKDLMDLLELSPAVVEEACRELGTEIRTRADELDLDLDYDQEAILKSISAANQALGRLNTTLRTRANLAERQAVTLEAVSRFHENAGAGRSLIDTCSQVASSASEIYAARQVHLLLRSSAEDDWELLHFGADGRVLSSDVVHPPQEVDLTEILRANDGVSLRLAGALPWVEGLLGGEGGHRLLPLPCTRGVTAVLLLGGAATDPDDGPQWEALSRTWASSITSAARHEDSRRMGEQLADANRALTEMQTELARRQALASLGEIAAGAAHEMNNPLCVISGRSQILSKTLEDPTTRNMAEQIATQAARLSELITALRLMVEPADLDRKRVDLLDVLEQAIQVARERTGQQKHIETVVNQVVPRMSVDRKQMALAVAELLSNALESEGSTHVELRVHIDSFSDRLMIQVQDDGPGLSDHALAHAFDPFFSDKPAGRQPGLGLARARRHIEAHGGRVSLVNRTEGGAIATIWLASWRAEPQSREVA